MAKVTELNGVMKETEVEQKRNNDDNGDRSAEVVRWERFLPRVALRVLLVEADHSTRQIIAALLQKCSYTVIAVPDGLKAWETLKRKAPDLDLILTEVELPAISGYALLSLIMEHEICKNIPVIMMSSHDSVGMVLKCMLKGASDFLIKPIRRNELRNLWQHVWRRHAISTPPQNTFPQKKLKTASENNSASNKSSGSVASSKKNNECSERLSEAQDVSQLKSSSKSSEIDDVVKHEDFTKIERESAKQNGEAGVAAEISITIAPEAAKYNETFELTDLRLEQVHGCAETANKDEILRSDLGRDNPGINTEIHECTNEQVEHSKGAIDLITKFENLSKHHNENCGRGNATKFDCDTQLGLSLRRDFPGSSCKKARETTEETQRLNHSDTSAFSWYSNSKLLQPLFPTQSITATKVNNPIVVSDESHKLSEITSGNYCNYGCTDQKQENMTSTVIGQCSQVRPKSSTSHSGLLPATGVISDLKSKGHGNAFTSVFRAQSGIRSMWNPKPVCQKESSPFPTSISSHSNPESHNSDQRYDWSNEATHAYLNHNVKDNIHSDLARHDSPAADRSAGNSLCHDTANRISSSAYGSMGSGNDGDATSAMVSRNNPEGFSDNSCHNSDGLRVTDSHRYSQREAALTKFRLKRKERCYEKKVRYQSRKRLAEQRPRVKGQFVRQVHNDHPTTGAITADFNTDCINYD
ncbi:two-component response regulator-like APRR3 isoform X2 [Abrus precatorius]|uniref:Two-component response regulator-like APRR3 isoform X2 n=1 Tax=Abrus precatorius TaxID=3816 RepID=A0A8B8JR61_ABRPR|nr:two-component response regulator-like APRR3 isoform X2 [Abrus precatorius]